MSDRKIIPVNHGRRVLTEDEAREKGAILVPPGSLPAGIRKIQGKDLAKTLPPEMVHTRKVICSECSVVFTETIISPLGEAPTPRDPDERPDLCQNCFKKLNRFPIIGAQRPRGRDVPRRI